MVECESNLTFICPVAASLFSFPPTFLLTLSCLLIFYSHTHTPTAGEDAYFQKVQGSGVILIPCDNRDIGRMELVVRVMDEDFGKRDDLLGELVIDAADLARSGQMKSFPLSRNGKPEKGQVVMSAKMTPFASLFPTNTAATTGMAVSRVALKDQCLVLTVHSATGLRKADWGGRNDVYVQCYRPPPTKDIVAGKKLPGPDKKTVLPEGTTTYPFAFQLRNDAPGSAEIPAGDRAHVRYDLYANASFANWRDPSSRRTISVIPNRPTPKLELLSPAEHSTPFSPIYGCSCCGMKCCKEEGMVSTSLKLNRRAYAPGEKIEVGGKVVNDTKKDMPVSVVLRQYIVLHSAGRSATQSRSDFMLSQGLVSAGGELDISSFSPCITPHVFPSFSGGVEGPINRSFYPCLKWTYSIEVRAGSGKDSFATAVHSRIPILVSTAPPFAEAVEKARSMRNDVTIDNPWQIFDFAVHGPEPSETTPKITGEEDAGRVMPATGIGFVTTTDYSEDRGRLGPEPRYQPVVNTFDNTTLLSSDGTDPPSPSAPAAQHAATTITFSEEQSNGGVTSLLSSLDDAYDKRKAVGEWIRDHPDGALKLTPDDVSSILSKVTFSLDQASVAGEIAAGFERSGNLTCAHIVSAMRTCKYSMSDVAKAMAPFANDPQNKGAVLDQLDYSFEKGDVAKYFRK
mmetsp:Transcript_27643/g.79794  ORF Transcript_27643/g.79794 Transcript_27643/m.79794 type:complete len:682 (-) Transcript_27643:40-2085(-)